jgi:hypothetical protein
LRHCERLKSRVEREKQSWGLAGARAFHRPRQISEKLRRPVRDWGNWDTWIINEVCSSRGSDSGCATPGSFPCPVLFHFLFGNGLD